MVHGPNAFQKMAALHEPERGHPGRSSSPGAEDYRIGLTLPNGTRCGQDGRARALGSERAQEGENPSLAELTASN